MSPAVTDLARPLIEAGWAVDFEPSAVPLPVEVAARYPWISPLVLAFVTQIRSAISPDEKTWMLGAAGYHCKGASAYAWNEWEIQSLDTSAHDEDWTAGIKAFWDDHFPIALSVRGRYEYHALRRDHTIVHGGEPEYEDPSPFAACFADFLVKVAAVDNL